MTGLQALLNKIQTISVNLSHTWTLQHMKSHLNLSEHFSYQPTVNCSITGCY